jgi:hypothetical protein
MVADFFSRILLAWHGLVYIMVNSENRGITCYNTHSVQVGAGNTEGEPNLEGRVFLCTSSFLLTDKAKML